VVDINSKNVLVPGPTSGHSAGMSVESRKDNTAALFQALCQLYRRNSSMYFPGKGFVLTKKP
jgi:hypothetical protein